MYVYMYVCMHLRTFLFLVACHNRCTRMYSIFSRLLMITLIFNRTIIIIIIIIT
jgi:hypothetical protein